MNIYHITVDVGSWKDHYIVQANSDTQAILKLRESDYINLQEIQCDVTQITASVEFVACTF